MPVLCDLIGPGAPLDATTASVIGLPRAGPRGSPWRFVRAALPHSLASELTSSTDRTTLGSCVKNISAILDQRKKASLERRSPCHLVATLSAACRAMIAIPPIAWLLLRLPS